MKICIIGAGAMGSLFGAFLAEAGHQVGLVEINPAYLQAIRRNQGIILEENNARRLVPCSISSDVSDFCNSDLCLVFVKATATAQVAQDAARSLNRHGYVLTLQNGMGNADTLAGAVLPEKVLAGSTSHGALLLEPGVVRHSGAGITVLGAWQEEAKAAQEAARRIARVFDLAGIASRFLPDVRSAIWDKLFVNIGINAIGALLAITNGQIGSHEDACKVARMAMEEARAVALSLGINVRSDLYAHFLDVCELTASNYCSMLQDMRAKRPTEVDFIHGAVCKIGAEQNIPTPVNDVLASLVRTAQYYNLQGDNL